MLRLLKLFLFLCLPCLTFSQETFNTSDTLITIGKRSRIDENGIDQYTFYVKRENPCNPKSEDCEKLKYFIYYYSKKSPEIIVDLKYLKTHSKRIRVFVRGKLKVDDLVFGLYISNGVWGNWIEDNFGMD